MTASPSATCKAHVAALRRGDRRRASRASSTPAGSSWARRARPSSGSWRRRSERAARGGRGQRHRGHPARAGGAGPRRRATRSSPRPSPPPSPPSPSCARGRGRSSPTSTPRPSTSRRRRSQRALTPRTRALLPVHLYGHPADLDPLLELARRRGIPLVEDACQAIGRAVQGPAGGRAQRRSARSRFYPTKNLGAFGDGGAVVVDDPEVAARLRRLRNGGQSDRYRHEVAGINSRLDEMQAAVLRVKLAPPRGLDGAAPRPGRALPRGLRRRRRGRCPSSSRTRARSTTSTWCAIRGATPWPPPCRSAASAPSSTTRSRCTSSPPSRSWAAGRATSRWRSARPARSCRMPLYPEMTDAQAEAVIRAIREVAPGLR